MLRAIVLRSERLTTMAAIHHVSRNFPVYSGLAYVIASFERIGEAILSDGPYYLIRFDLLTQYFVNYADHGFAKRALVGTLLKPVTGALDNPEAVVFWLMVAMNLAAFAAILVLTERFLPHRTGEGGDTVAILRCALAIGSLGVMQVAHDLGRLDMLNFAVLTGAVALIARGRVLPAALLSVVGVLIHEGFAVYAAPLVIAVAWQSLRAGLSPGRAAARLAPLVAAIAVTSFAVLLYGNSDLAVAVRHGGGGYVWARGLVEVNRSLGLGDILILAAYWGALGTVLLCVYRGANRAFDLMFVAAVCPLALNFLGIDAARWLTLAFYLLLINLAIQVRVFDLRLGDLPPWSRRFAGSPVCFACRWARWGWSIPMPGCSERGQSAAGVCESGFPGTSRMGTPEKTR